MKGYRDKLKAGPHMAGLTDHDKHVDIRVAFDSDGVCWAPDEDTEAVLAARPDRFEVVERDDEPDPVSSTQPKRSRRAKAEAGADAETAPEDPPKPDDDGETFL